ncbi:Crp/Fnr family transcriptional regulator [Magnetofaba australis]|uniref:Putative cAMP-binding protein n=1 Tax=Magnetofaba australis IT-1 TaxID=1434232 RepID=A0A1Y2K1S0_9PROT|nr:Crp/Fnr family transcriptional regulator [Magnetofaba australis]OSM01981.1 putative cAMP-binding protein [Magnetofaba australis IT-1]
MADATQQISDQLSDSGRALFRQRMVKHLLPMGSMALNRGDEVSGAYFVLRGELRVFTITPNGKEALLYRIRPGETCVLAINSLFQELPYPAWVRAAAETQVGVLSGAAYRQLFAHESVIQEMTVAALARAVFGLMGQIEQSHALTVEQRLAGLLLNYADASGRVAMTQQAMADEIGAAREVVGRHLSRFARDGVTRSGRGAVTILSKERLHAIMADA